MNTRIRHGRTVVISPEVKLWRKRMRKYTTLKPKLIALVAEKQGDNAVTWFKTPLPALNGKTPKQYLNPLNIQFLYKTARKLLR